MMPSWPNRSTEEYLDRLKASDSQVRAEAAAALEVLNDSQAVAPLIEALADPAKNVRLRAAQALGKLGSTAAVIPLIKVLQDPEWEVRSQAVRSLERLGDRQATPFLCKLLQDREGDINYHVSLALGHLADPQALLPLLEVLKEGDKNRSFLAATALGQLGVVALPELIKALEHPNPAVRAFAAKALIHFKEVQAILALVKALKQDPDYEVKRQARYSLESLQRRYLLTNPNPSPEATSELEAGTNLTGLNGQSTQVNPSHPNKVQPYSQIELGQLVEQALQRHKIDSLENASFEELISRLTDPDWQIRELAVRHLSDKHDPRAIEPLLKALSDPSEEVRGQVVLALSELGDERVVEPLIEVLEDPDVNPSTYAYNSLRRLGKKAVAGLLKALEHKSVRIRVRAASLLADMGETSALPALTALEQHDGEVDPLLGTVKDAAARAIGKLKQPFRVFRVEETAPKAKALEVKATSAYDWQELLADWSEALLNSDELSEAPSPAALQTRWLGKGGASEEQLARAEARLGIKLPPSYRAFLKVSNGWGPLNYSIEQLWPVEEVEWFAVRNQDWIDAWNDDTPVSDEDYFVYGAEQSEVNLRPHYLKTALEISTEGDSAIMLLNPQIVTAEGEWEAWLFVTWFPGARRYRSFWEMMQEQYRTFLSSLEDNRS